jgi:hypothetical protein
MANVSAADILGDWRPELVEVTPPGSDRVVRLRHPTYGEWHKLAAAHQGLDGKTPSADLITETIAACLADDNGKRLLQDPAKARVLLDANPRQIMWLYTRCWETVLRNDDVAIQELEKNSGAGQER